MFFNPRANYASSPYNGLGNLIPVSSSGIPTQLPQLNQHFWRPTVPIATSTPAWSLVPPTSVPQVARVTTDGVPQPWNIVTATSGRLVPQPTEAWRLAPMPFISESCQHLPMISEKKVDHFEGAATFGDERLVETERLLIEEMRLYNNRPKFNWYFIVVGVLLLCLAIPTTLFCISVEQQYYTRYWTGIVLIIFGISGYIHQGDYLKYWKSALYIIVGMVTTLCVLVCSALMTMRFVHQVVEVAQFSDWKSYLEEMSTRMMLNNDYPRTNLANPPDMNMRVCLAMSGVSVFVTLAGYVALTVTILVIDKFYSSHFVITRRVQPFCTPVLFNPYGQSSLGEAQIFIGFVLQSLVFGNSSFAWQNTYIPVIAGIIPMVAGVFAAISLKSCGLNNKIWSALGLVLEVLSVVMSVVAIVIISLGMSDNIVTLSNTGVMTYTAFSKALMIVSIVNFCVSDIVCIVNIFYSVALAYRLVTCLCCPARGSLEVVAQEIYRRGPYDSFEDDGVEERSGYRKFKSEAAASRFYD